MTFHKMFKTSLHSGFEDDNTGSLVKPKRILSSSHGTDISMKDNYYFYVESQLELCVAVLRQSTIFCSVSEDFFCYSWGLCFYLEHENKCIC